MEEKKDTEGIEEIRGPRKYKAQFVLIGTAFAVVALGILFFFIIFRADGLRRLIHRAIRIVMPFIIGAVIAYMLRPMCNFFEKRLKKLFRSKHPERQDKLSGPISIVISFLIFLLLAYILLAAMVPQLFRSVRLLLNTLPRSTDELKNWIGTLMLNHPILANYLGSSIEEAETVIVDWLEKTIMPSLGTIMGNLSSGIQSILSMLGNIFVGLIASIYILADRKKLAAQGKMIIYGIFPEKAAAWLDGEIKYADRMFDGFLIGKIVDSAIVGVICFIACTVFAIPNAMLVSVLIGITNIIPFFGPYIGLVPSVLIILLYSPSKALIFVIIDLILQQLDGNLIGPRILGDRTGLSGLGVLFSILFFGGLWGFIGMIVGVPLFAVIYDIFRQIVSGGLRQHGKSDMRLKYEAAYHEARKKDKDKREEK